MAGSSRTLEAIAVLMMLVHIFICPFTKVEESFNVQAIHDILNHGFDVSEYDHLEFPGVVPRSFLGPLLVAIVSYPFKILVDVTEASKVWQQYTVRTVLGLANTLSLIVFSRAVGSRFGGSVKNWLLLVTVTQFHFLFYASRPVPNVMVLSLVLLALSSWLHQRHKLFIWLSGASVIIFRFDLIMFLGLILLKELYARRLRFTTAVATTIYAGTVILGLTVAVDSYFWQRWLWPEGEVMWYNVVMNKSSNWGTSPFLWYFYSALPRALSATTLLIPVGIYWTRHVTTLLWPAVGYILLFSCLPHKELRFIMYTFPVLNTAMACALSSLWKSKGKSFIRKTFAVGATSLLLVNCLATAAFLYISHFNYPGGVAIETLHKLEHSKDVHIHIDVFTAQTGVTRFTQVRNSWIYNKTEDLTPGGEALQAYTHLLVGSPSEEEKAISIYSATHTVLGTIQAYDRIKIELKSYPPVKILFKNKCFILKKR